MAAVHGAVLGHPHACEHDERHGDGPDVLGLASYRVRAARFDINGFDSGNAVEILL